MSNLAKLNDLALEVEKSLAKTKAVQNYLLEVEKVISSLEVAAKEYTALGQKVKEMTEHISLSSQVTKETLNSTISKIEKNWLSFSKDYEKKLLQLNESVHSSLLKSSSDLHAITTQFHSTTGKQLSDFHADFKRFHTGMVGNLSKFQNDIDINLNEFKRELDGNMSTRLDKHSSDIQLNFRNEATQIQRSLDITVKEKILELEQSMSSQLKKQSRSTLILGIVSTIIIIASILLSFIRVNI